MSEQRYNGTIVSGRKDGKLANSDNIFDKNIGKMQSDINKEMKTRTDNSFDSLKQTKQSAEDGGENVITLTRHEGTSEQVKFYNGSKGSKGEKGDKGDKGDKGEVGMQGNSGVADASNKTLVNDAITGGETDFLSAEIGKLGILTYDCSKGGSITHATLQDAINSVPTAFQKVGLTITYKSGDTIYRYTLKANTWSADPANWFSVEDKLSDLSTDAVILSYGNQHEEIASKMKEHANGYVIKDSGDVVFMGAGNMYIMKAYISNYDLIKVVTNKAGNETQYAYAIYNSYSIFDKTTFLFGSINNGVVDLTQLDGAKTILVSTTDKNMKVTAFAHTESSSLARINKVQNFAITKDNSIAVVEFDGEFKPYDQMIALFYCKNKCAHVTNLALKTSDGTFYRSANNQIEAYSEGYVIINLVYNSVVRKGNFFLVSEGYTMGTSDSIGITNLRIFKVNQNPIGATLTDKFKNLTTTVSNYANQAYGLYENGYINCIGDSLTAGTGGNPYSVHLNRMLDTKYNGRFFCNMLAVGGENTTTILGRVSAMPYQLAESIILPANTDKVEAHLISSWNGSNVTPLIQGDVGIQFIIINGIKCKLSLDNKKYYINRIDNGSTPITLPQGEVITTQAFYQSRYPYANIIWIGTNGGWKDADDLVEQINTVVNTYRSKEYCVLGIHFTAYKDKWSSLESSMRRKFGSHFCNSRLYLSTNAMYDLGLTPRSADLSAMNNGECPPSLMSDGVHLNDNGYKAIATLIYRNIFGNRTLTE